MIRLESRLEMESDTKKIHFKTSNIGFSSSLWKMLKKKKGFNSSKAMDAL